MRQSCSSSRPKHASIDGVRFRFRVLRYTFKVAATMSARRSLPLLPLHMQQHDPLPASLLTACDVIGSLYAIHYY